MKIQISAIILSKNNQNDIKNCLNKLKFCDEIILIDDYSDDETCEVASKYNAKIYQRHLDSDFASQRNFAMKKAKNDWVLFIDADEIVSDDLANKIKEISALDKYKVYKIRRKNVLLGKTLDHGEWGYSFIIRLMKKGTGQWVRKVHEYYKTDEYVGVINEPIIHNQNKSLQNLIQDINKYSYIHKNELVKEGKKAYFYKIVFWPLAKFVQNYFVKMGFRDGVHGLVMSILMSFHSFLAWSNLWIEEKN